MTERVRAAALDMGPIWYKNGSMRTHRVIFQSPGALCSEPDTFPIYAWDTAAAVEMAGRVVQRHGAKPYGFFFTTSLEVPDVPDGEGGMLRVMAKNVDSSGVHFLGGDVLRLDDIAARNDPADAILYSNMRGNGWPIVIENRYSYKVTQVFGERDVVVDARGVIIERGDTPERVAYRVRMSPR